MRLHASGARIIRIANCTHILTEYQDSLLDAIEREDKLLVDYYASINSL
jgi:hypothetical protein